MQSTIASRPHLTTTQWSPVARPTVASSSSSASMDSFTSSASMESSAGIYNPRMFAQRFGTGSTNGSSHAVASGQAAESGNSLEGYGGRRLSDTDQTLVNAEETYNRFGGQSLSLDDRGDIGRLISRSPQIGSVGTNNNSERCGGAAIFNAMLLDGDHSHNAGAIEATLGERLTPQQHTALDHMRAGRMTPDEAALLQEALFDYSENRDHVRNGGLNLEDMRTTVTELRSHGAFPNTRELNFRREIVGGNRDNTHWTVSSRTAHGTHFADSWPSEDGYARVTGAEEAAFSPYTAPDRVMADSLDLVLDNSTGSGDRVSTATGPTR